MIKDLILTPPITFIIILAVTILISELLSALSFKRKKQPEGMGKAYACGEDTPENRIQPDYGQFFPFAFFFTILHVVALMVTTVPVQTVQTFSIAIVYILGAIVALFILFRR